jgi:hypothetical protein
MLLLNGELIMNLDELNSICAAEYRAKIEAEQESQYQEYLNAKLEEARIMEYAANSYDADAESFANQ